MPANAPALASLPPPPDPTAKPVARRSTVDKSDASSASSKTKRPHNAPEFAAVFSQLLAGVPNASHEPACDIGVGGVGQSKIDGFVDPKDGMHFVNGGGGGGTGVKLALAFDMEMHDIAGIEESFKEAVAHDLADAVGGRRDKIHIAHVLPGSIPYTLASFVDVGEGVCGPERRALNVARELERQAAEDSSLLKCGRYTSKIINLRTLAPILSTGSDGGAEAAGEGGAGYLAKSYMARGDTGAHVAASDPLLQAVTTRNGYARGRDADTATDAAQGRPGPAQNQGHGRFAFPPMPTDATTLAPAPPDTWASHCLALLYAQAQVGVPRATFRAGPKARAGRLLANAVAPDLRSAASSLPFNAGRLGLPPYNRRVGRCRRTCMTRRTRL